ncbi:MAG TPA: hypothetical protein VIV63_09355 [Steroidobacteraceae bacterium]
MHNAKVISRVFIAWLAAPLAQAADPAEKLRGFGLAESSAASPGYGRVVIAFLLVAAMAWGIVWVLRRYGLRGPAAATGLGSSVRPLARTSLPGGITCHVIETQGRQVLITVTRHGVTSLVLGDAAAPSIPGPAP